MAMRYLLYEDEKAADLFPLALLRPVFELICGRESLRRRLHRWFPRSEWGAVLRPELSAVYAEEQPEAHLNNTDWWSRDATWVVNGRWLPAGCPDASRLRPGTAAYIGDRLAWAVLPPEDLRLLAGDCFGDALERVAAAYESTAAEGHLIDYPWDLINHNREQLRNDFADQGLSQGCTADHVQLLGDPRDLYIAEATQLDPYVVIDARTGPVSIDAGVQIQSFTRIEGPCHIASGAQVFRAQIRGGTTIGPHCRVGGEIEESILHAFVNKYHDGFLGHSYVCPWVNLGAHSTTSDLKNDYSNVCVPLNGDLVDTGLRKVGSFIGDHSKTAIDSMFNTGTSVGVMSLVLPGGRLLPRHIPSFCSMSFGLLTSDLDLDSAIATARAVMARRDQELTAAMESALRDLCRRTEAERARAIQRSLQRRLKA